MPYFPPAGSSSFDPASPGAIGGTTPSTGAFTTLSTTGAITSGGAISATGSLTASTDIVLGAINAVSFSGRSRITSGGLNGNITFSNAAGANSCTLGFPGTNAAPIWQFGGSDTASPVAQQLKFQNATGTNAAAPDAKLYAPGGTGTAAIASLIMYSPVAGSSGSTAHTQVESARLMGGALILPSSTVAALPAASTVPFGRRFVTDATSPTFGATVTGGGSTKAPVWSDGTNWIVG